MILRARYIWTGSTCLENGAIRIENGRIVEVGGATRIAESATTDLGDTLLLPGFVNAHTHLELTHLHNKVPPGPDFADWLGRLVEAMLSAIEDGTSITSSVQEGVRQSVLSGVTCVGDVTRSARLTRQVLATVNCRAVSFGEVIALGKIRDKLADRLLAAADCQRESERLRVGISPHSPYALEPEGLARCAAVAERSALPLCIHVAETTAEAEYTQDLCGRLRYHFERLGLWDNAIPCPGMAPVELVHSANLLTPRTILAHMNYCTNEEIRQIANSGAHVAYCPRTHAAFGHPPHRFRDMLAAGVNVCVGTDSLASNPDLSVLNELRFLRAKFPELPAGELLAMGTTRSATALGMNEIAGRIEVGRPADFTCVPLETSRAVNPLENVLGSTMSPTATWIDGLPQPSSPPISCV